MKKKNITIIDLDKEIKPLLFKKILTKYYDNSYIENKILNIKEKQYWYFKEDEHEFNIINNKDDIVFKDYFNSLNESDCCFLVINANDYKNKKIDNYYYLLYTLGISNILLIISNLENLPYQDAIVRFNEIHSYLKKKLKKIGLKSIEIMPFSKLEIEEYNEWFNKYDIISILKNNTKDINIGKDTKKFLVVNNVFNINNNYGVINGVLSSGIICKNDVISIKPENKIVNVLKIEKNHKEIEKAYPNDYIGILVDIKDIEKKSIITNFDSEIKKTKNITCRIIVVKDKININDKLTMYYDQNHINCNIHSIFKNLRLIQSSKDNLTKSLTKHKVGIVSIKLESEIYLDSYNSSNVNSKQGRVLFMDNDDKLAAIGIVKVIK